MKRRQTGVSKLPKGTVEAAPFATAVIAKNLKTARRLAGFTVPELARTLGIDRAAVSRRENGRARADEAYVRRVHRVCDRVAKKWVLANSLPERGPQSGRKRRWTFADLIIAHNYAVMHQTAAQKREASRTWRALRRAGLV